MTGLGLALDAFHFLRPAALILLVPLAVLWWRVRRGQTRREMPPEGLAPHLRAALTIGDEARRRLLPIDGVAMALLLLTLGLAGPTWSRQPDPFAAQSAPLVILLHVGSSMEDTDLAPSRLERSKQKIRDLLDLRAGARTALVAYAGSAHVVVPMTEDPGVVLPYLEGLSPAIMPADGNRAGLALDLAAGILTREDGPGGVLLVTDGLDPADVPAIADWSGALSVLAARPDGQADPGLDQLSVPVLAVTPDDSDIRRIDRQLAAAYRQALLEDTDQPWQDRGPWLAWPAALLALLWFRRGWTMRWAVIAGLALMLQPGTARADGLADWFFTPDQQGRRAYERKDYDRAAALFTDPLWRGYALYKAGDYEEAMLVLARLGTAQAAFISGVAALRSRNYRDGIRAFETALARDPDYPGAAENLELARVILDYVETTREQSDTGEDRGIGADEVVFDNDAARGADTQMEVPQEDGAGLLTADQWMSTVDTRTGDFLKLRFALEASADARAGQDPAGEAGQ